MAKDIQSQIAKMTQDCVSQNPVIILGSGASAPYGLRGMGDLAKHLIRTVKTVQEESGAWSAVCADLNAGCGLEEALQKISIPSSLVTKIVTKTWEAIACDDLSLMQRAILRSTEFSLSDMLKGIFRSTHKVVSIITTNYDRVAEYAADLSGYFHETGFCPGLIRSRQQSDFIPYSNNQEIRRVRIWKVHGSIDWFMDTNGIPVCLPLSSNIPEGFVPLIVTPGISKFEKTHDEPFRSAIHGADGAISKANAILCVGYGFRDRHIQPKIVERCRHSNIPIVVLARTLTEEAHDFLRKSGGRVWIALERHGDGTKVFSSKFPEGIVLDNVALWSFDEFNKMVF